MKLDTEGKQSLSPELSILDPLQSMVLHQSEVDLVQLKK